MSDLPTDTVTFLFTDVEISTQLWDRDAGQHEVAATRFGALERAGDERPTNQMVPAGAAVEALRVGLGVDAFEASSDRGRATGDDELVVYLHGVLRTVIGPEPAR